MHNGIGPAKTYNQRIFTFGEVAKREVNMSSEQHKVYQNMNLETPNNLNHLHNFSNTP